MNQTLDGPAYEQAPTDCLVALRGDKPNWDLPPSVDQFLLQFGAGPSSEAEPVGAATMLNVEVREPAAEQTVEQTYGAEVINRYRGCP